MLDESIEVKIIFVGNANVGKTSIASRFINGTFSNILEPTVGAAFSSKEVELNGVKCTFNLWDTAGQETYRYLVPMYYRNADIAVIVFDLSNQSSFNDVETWVEDVKKNVGESIVFLLCGNKCDIDPKVVDIDSISSLSRRMGLIYVETSASNGDGISKLFEIAISEHLKKKDEKSKMPSNSVNVATKTNKDKGCC